MAALVQRGELQSALEVLEPLATRKSGKLAEWAREQQAQIREQIEGVSTLCRVAAKLIRKHDYAEAIIVLSSVPVEGRTEELNDLLSEAEGKEEESRLLLQDIDQAIRNDQPKELLRLVKRFLQLKPGNKAVQKLAAELKQHGAERVLRRHRGRSNYFDPAGQVWDPLHIAYYVGGLALLCAAVYLRVIIFQTKNGTVIIEVHDPRVTVNFANDEITATSSDKTFRLKATEKRTLQLEIDGLTVDSSTQEIAVAQNETKLISAKLVNGRLDLQINTEKKTFAVPEKGVAKVADKRSAAGSPTEAAGVPALAADGWTELFNGRDLAGWKVDPAFWAVKEGVLASRPESLHKPAYLLSETVYSDFEVRLQFRLLNDGNSGVQYRTKWTPPGDGVGGDRAPG